MVERPLAFTGEPCVRWPPWSRLRPSTVSPGSNSARYTHMLALAPECGCTLACSAPNSAFARSIGQLLDRVDIDVAAVVALAGIALGVLVRQHRADGPHHRRGGEVLAGDQLEAGRAGARARARTAAPPRSRVRCRLGRDVTMNCSSSSVIWATRRACRPPSKSVDRNRSTISSARPTPTTRAPDRQHVGVVVLTRQARRVQAVAERGADALDLVGSELLTLARTTEHDADVGLAVAHRASGSRAELGIVDALRRVRAMVDDVEPGRRETSNEMLLELVSGVVGPERNDGHRGEPTRRR